MTNTARIECINKTNRYDVYDRISHVGGRSPTPWRLTQQEAVAAIESGLWRFHVTVGTSTAWVIVAVSASGNKYLKTQNDGEHPNNLLSLSECSW